MTTRRMVVTVTLGILIPSMIIGLIAKSWLVFFAVLIYGAIRVFCG